MSEYLKPAAAIALPYVGGAFGSIIARKNKSPWYENIKRPSWRPPNYLFGPVWTALYGGMGYASYLVWKDGGGFQGDAALPLALYGTQLALNWAWTPIFFGAHRLGLNIKRPSWRPPNYLFGPVWTALYGGMGYASYLVWKDGGGFQGDAALPLALYGTQLALNWAWTPIFFGAHRLGLATIEIGCLWGTIVATIFAFREVNTTAAYILVPYLGWVTFASALTFKIWRMNKEDKDTKTS